MTINITEESDGYPNQDETEALLKESKARSKAALDTIKIKESVGGFPMSAADHRSKASEHGRKASGLVSGDAKDSHLTAERAHNRAADCIDAANLSTRKAEALE